MTNLVRLGCLSVVALALSAAPFAQAADEADELMPGKVTVIKPGTLAKFVAKPATGDAFVLPGATNDPTVEGGSLRIFDTATTAGDNLYPLPVQPAPLGWKGLGNPAGSKGYKYKGAGTPSDPCTVVLIKAKVVKGVCRGASVTLAPPFDGEVGIILTAGTDSKRYCASFGGAEVKNAPELAKRKDATAAACATPVPPPPPSDAIFVDGLAGDDGSPGTMAAPMKTVQAGISAAQLGGVDVYVSVGTYAESITLADGVGVFGGYDAADAWSFSPANVVTISGGTTAVLGTSINTETHLANLTIVAADSATPGTSSHGLYIVSSTGLVVSDVTVQSGAGGAGGVGSTGTPGANGGNGGQGNPGCENSGALFCDTCSQPAGGVVGTSACGRTGGIGGVPGLSSAGGSDGGTGQVGTSGGPGAVAESSNGSPGTNGSTGTSGSPGTGGTSLGNFTAAGYEPADGLDGGTGDAGNGGGGGGGGGGGTTDCDSYGSSGGGGGGGGCGGTGGGGGQGGGGSFAIYLWDSTVSLTNVEMRTGNGGAGGDGAAGGTAGTGGAAGPGGPYGGGSEQDDGGNGAPGGSGGDGGAGGAGGGGGGGPSIGLGCGGVSVLALDVGNAYQLGNAGAPGGGPVNSGLPGIQAQKQGC